MTLYKPGPILVFLLLQEQGWGDTKEDVSRPGTTALVCRWDVRIGRRKGPTYRVDFLCDKISSSALA